VSNKKKFDPAPNYGENLKKRVVDFCPDELGIFAPFVKIPIRRNKNPKINKYPMI